MFVSIRLEAYFQTRASTPAESIVGDASPRLSVLHDLPKVPVFKEIRYEEQPWHWGECDHVLPRRLPGKKRRVIPLLFLPPDVLLGLLSCTHNTHTCLRVMNGTSTMNTKDGCYFSYHPDTCRSIVAHALEN